MAGMIDTHAFYQTLKEGGFEERQAEAMTRGIALLMHGTLATKTDIADVRTEIANLRAELKTDIAHLRADVRDDISKATNRSVGLLATYTTILVGVSAAINHIIR